MAAKINQQIQRRELDDMQQENPWLPTNFDVINVRQDAPDVVTLTFAGQKSLQPNAGQFNMLNVFGRGEVPISFSAIDENTFSHTIKSVGHTTTALCRTKMGEKIGLRGPFGSQWSLAATKNKDVLVVAGGLGIAPLMPLLRTLSLRNPAEGRLELISGARSPEDFLFLQELVDLPNWEFHSVVDRADRSWVGQVGMVTDLLPRVAMDSARSVAFICGPEVMMRHTALGLVADGWNAAEIFISMERNMKCALGLCGRCQWGPHFVCRHGAVFSYAESAELLTVKGL